MTHRESGACLVVVGAGPIGMYVAARLAEYQRVVVIDADPASPESTERRTQFLRSPEVATYPSGLPVQHRREHSRIEFRPGCRLIAIDRQAKRVVTQEGERIPYQHLVLALGAEPVVPAFAESCLFGVQTAYSQDDFHDIATAAGQGETIAIIGGGLLAVELAGNLVLKTSVRLCPRGRLLSRYADKTIARRVTGHLRKRGVQVIIASEVDDLERRHNRVGIHFRGGERGLTADRVVLSCGLRPRTALAKNAGLEVADGICVDHAMRTSDVHILAVGDCAESASATVRGNVARGIEDADKAAAVLRGQAPAPSEDRRAALRRIAIGDRDFLSIRHTHPCEASQHARITRHLPHGAFSVTLDDRRIVACQALLPKEQTDRLSQLAEEQVVIDRRMALCLRLGLLPRSSFANDPILCHCAGVRRSRILHAAGSPGDDLEAMTRATGATRYCGACLERVTAVFEGRRTKPPVRAILLSILALVAIAAAAGTPTLAPGESVRALAFKAYVLLTRNSVRQISGYVSVVFIVLALGVIAPRRRPSPMRTSSLHVIYGTLALAVLPLHVLGGVTIGSGLNRVLVAPFLICVLLGVVVFLRRSLRSALWLHAAVTVVLLAAIAIHVVDVYRY